MQCGDLESDSLGVYALLHPLVLAKLLIPLSLGFLIWRIGRVTPPLRVWTMVNTPEIKAGTVGWWLLWASNLTPQS